jgi:hypothetical protein
MTLSANVYNTVEGLNDQGLLEAVSTPFFSSTQQKPGRHEATLTKEQLNATTTETHSRC